MSIEHHRQFRSRLSNLCSIEHMYERKRRAREWQETRRTNVRTREAASPRTRALAGSVRASADEKAQVCLRICRRPCQMKSFSALIDTDGVTEVSRMSPARQDG